MSFFWGSSNQAKPRSMLGKRRSMTMKTNTTLNNTNTNADFNFSSKPAYEPSFASTPLHDHRNIKEDIYLSSIKPSATHSVRKRLSPNFSNGSNAVPKTSTAILSNLTNSARKIKSQSPNLPKTTVSSYSTQKGASPGLSSHRTAPYKRVLGRRSMALRKPEPTPTVEEDYASNLSKSVNYMNDVNTSLKLSEPTPKKCPPKADPFNDVNNGLNNPFDNNSKSLPDITTSSSPESTTATNTTNLDRTFEIIEEENESESSGEDNVDFKTPSAVNIIKDNSLFKTPMSTIKSINRNLLNVINEDDFDNDDSFVENERTVMLQFNKTNNQTIQLNKSDNKTITESQQTVTQNNQTNNNELIELGTLIETFKNESSQCVNTLFEQMNNNFNNFMEQQRTFMNSFKNEHENRFNNFYNQFQEYKNKNVNNNTTRMSSNDTVVNNENIPVINVINETNTEADKEAKEEETTAVLKQRQSMAFSNFRKSSNFLKTPLQSKAVSYKSTMTPRTYLSTCVRDQLEDLEKGNDSIEFD